MAYYGPWVTPTAVDVVETPTLTHFTGFIFNATDFAALAEHSYDDPTVFDFHQNVGWWAVDDASRYFLGQIGVDIDTQGAVSPWFPPTPPPDAVDVDVDGDSTLTNLHVQVDVGRVATPNTQDFHVFLTTNDPADLTYDPANGGLPGTHIIPGGAVDAYATALFATSASSVTLAADVPVTHIAPRDTVTGIAAIQLVVGVTEQITHTPPTLIPGTFSGGAWQVDQATLTFTFQPPNYRWVFGGRPPLAHRQRRDGTATAGPQLAHIGTAGSRPSLAWRQDTP